MDFKKLIDRSEATAECGLRGSKAFCKQYAKRFSDIPTYLIALDSIHEEKYHGVNYYDLNQTVKTDKELSDLYRKAAEEVGVQCGKTGIPVLGGSTDGAAFVKGGFRATSVSAMPHAVPGWYHTRRDTPENLCKPGIAACYKTCIHAVMRRRSDRGFQRFRRVPGATVRHRGNQ